MKSQTKDTDISVIIDWLQFTLTATNVTADNTIINVLHLDVQNFIKLDYGKMGYKQQLFYNDTYILYDGNPGMGVHVIMSGQGCRYYESEQNLVDLIERISTAGGKLTRIDLAMDDKVGKTIPFNQLVKDITSGNTVTKWKHNIEIIKRNNSDGSVVGHTVNVGSGASRLYMRLYNKAMEQNIEGVWNRLELEIKKEYAEQVQKLITDQNVGQLMAEIINNYIRIVQPSENDSNKSRWTTKPYWEKLIATTEKQQLTVKPEERTIIDNKMWIENQVAPTLALITMSDDNTIDFLIEQIKQGKKRLKKKHLKKLNRGKDDE